MPGPQRNAAKPRSRAHRERGAQNTLKLPPECPFTVPKLPKSRDWTADEKARWRRLWTGPQANVWDESYIEAVAAYVVYGSMIMQGGASAWHAQEFRHLGDKLGLTPAGMLALGWEIDQ